MPHTKEQKKKYESSPKYLAWQRKWAEKSRRRRGIMPLSSEDRGNITRKASLTYWEGVSEEKKKDILDKLHVHAHSDKAKLKSSKTALDKGEKHQNARAWKLISPSGERFQFLNLSKFIRTHDHLFTEDQLRVTSASGKSRIAGSLYHLSPRKTHCHEQVHGWRWDSGHDIA
tara:strand:- start:89 stop:604 length:516 start_codon:yes stop_codon:yes gene_type:complete